MNKSKKNFRLTLNNGYNGIKHKNGIYGQVKRSYGDYLYYQDRVRFNMLFELWLVTDNKTQFESKG